MLIDGREVICAKHELPLDDARRCEGCEAETRAIHEELIKSFNGMTVTYSIPSGGPSAVKVDGEIVPIRHGSSYLEYYVPEALEEELTAYLDARIAAYKATCHCLRCREDRNTAHG